MARSLIIAGHYRRPTGYGGHIKQIVRALDELGIRIQLVDLPTSSLGALPKGKRDPWFDTLDRPGQLCRYPAHTSAASGQDC